MTSAAGPAELQPRGRLQSAYMMWGVGAVVACALAKTGLLRAPYSLGERWSDGWRAANSGVLIETRTRATRLRGRVLCACGTGASLTSHRSSIDIRLIAFSHSRIRRMGGARHTRQQVRDVRRA
ncbi:hypothetical protein G6F50_013437 [Rhizopus delemar]|uniref:Uncharacterized protein n=1 Tax=Rhizopus delemar TaxID=936053 RepID=A0A9P6YHA4_9FUNG|nr:hypothetical protein G6F50_013437 [Rhizopus delemar]